MNDDTSFTIEIEGEGTPSKLAVLQERLMQKVDEHVAPTGIFHWSMFLPDALAEYDGSSGAKPMNQLLFQIFYQELAAGALPSVTMAGVSDLDTRAEMHRERGVIPIAVANYDYTAARKQFVESLLRHVEDDTVSEIPDDVPDAEQLKEMAEPRHAFFASALLKQEYIGFAPLPLVHFGLAARFEIPSDCYLTNSAAELTGIEIDLDDGGGWRPIRLGEEVATQYATAGTKRVLLRAQTGGGELAVSFEIELNASVAPKSDEKWLLKSQYPNAGAKGHTWVFFGKGHTKLEAPILIAEGFPGNYTLNQIWDILNKEKLAENLLEAGKDIVIIGFADGTRSMEDNAGVVVAAIEKSASIIKADGKAPHLIVGGASMGGLVTRYALTWMEKAGEEHYTDKYFSLDTPHTGAYVPLSAQLFVNYFRWMLDKVGYVTVDLPKLLQSPAAQQMLLLWVEHKDDWGICHSPSPERTAFLKKLAMLGGYPKKKSMKKFGVADGRGDGQGNGLKNGVEAFFWNTGLMGIGLWGADLYTVPGLPDKGKLKIAGLKNTGFWNTFHLDNILPKSESAPGGTSAIYAGFNDTLLSLNKRLIKPNANCFIPTMSALAMEKLHTDKDTDLLKDISKFNPDKNEGGTWFDEYTFSSTKNLEHVELDKELAKWLYDRLKV